MVFIAFELCVPSRILYWGKLYFMLMNVLVVIPLWHLRTCLKLGNMNTIACSVRTPDLRKKLINCTCNRQWTVIRSVTWHWNAYSTKLPTQAVNKRFGVILFLLCCYHARCYVQGPLLQCRQDTGFTWNVTAGQDGNEQSDSAHWGREAKDRAETGFEPWTLVTPLALRCSALDRCVHVCVLTI